MVQENIPVTLQVEGAAAHLMQQGEIDWVIVGSDRIAANGDVANKIGTYGLAVLARHHGEIYGGRTGEHGGHKHRPRRRHSY